MTYTDPPACSGRALVAALTRTARPPADEGATLDVATPSVPPTAYSATPGSPNTPPDARSLAASGRDECRRRAYSAHQAVACHGLGLWAFANSSSFNPKYPTNAM